MNSKQALHRTVTFGRTHVAGATDGVARHLAVLAGLAEFPGGAG